MSKTITQEERRELRRNGPLAQCLRQLERDFTPEQLRGAGSAIRAAARPVRGKR